MRIINWIMALSTAAILGLTTPVLAQQSNPSPSNPHQLSTYELNRVITSWFQAGGVIVAAAAFVFSLCKNREDQKKDERDRQVALYESLKSEWSSFFLTCRNNPNLDIFFLPLECSEPISEEDHEQSEKERLEQIGFAQFFWIVQRIYVRACQDKLLDQFKREEWKFFLEEYFKRSNCRDAWAKLKCFYDKEFVSYIENNYASVSRVAVPNNLGKSA